MIPLKVAAETKFETSTAGELRAYATELGIEFKPNATGDALRKKILAQLGVHDEVASSRPAAQPVRIKSGGDIFPAYNLTPNGIWGGRRRRIKLPRPEGSKMAAAEPVAWNGKRDFYVPYDEVSSVPWPIFEILRTTRRPRAKAVKNHLPDGTVEITTGWDFDERAMSDYGDDPETKHLAGSLTEWYQRKGTAWFEERSLRQLQLIAAKCDIPSADRANGRVFTQDEILGKLKEFFFGFADAEADPMEEQAA